MGRNTQAIVEVIIKRRFLYKGTVLISRTTYLSVGIGIGRYNSWSAQKTERKHTDYRHKVSRESIADTSFIKQNRYFLKDYDNERSRVNNR